MADPSNQSFWALVLAGGDGTRLQSLTHLISGAPIPKQYCRILGPRSLLETTLSRVAPLVSAERTLAIINRDHLAIAAIVPAAPDFTGELREVERVLFVIERDPDRVGHAAHERLDVAARGRGFAGR